MYWDKILFRRYLEDGEELLFVAHQHWIALSGIAFKTAIFGFVLPGAIWYVFPAFIWVAILWAVAFWFYFLYHFSVWYYDAWLATNLSIIDIEWVGLFHHKSSRIPYSEVREVSYEMKGLWAMLLRFGNAAIGTSSGGKVELVSAARPNKVEMEIMDIRNRFLSEHKFHQSNALQTLIGDMLADHIKQKGIRLKRI